MKRFQFNRLEDETGNSGTGIVCEGVQFSNGRVVVNWLTDIPTISVYDKLEDAIFLHGHGGKTVIKKWIDKSPTAWHCYKCGHDTENEVDTVACEKCKQDRWN